MSVNIVSINPITAKKDVSRVIAAALAFPMDQVVQRYTKDHGLPLEVAKEHEVELKKYLVLCALRPGGGLGMSRIVDELWHTFIWFTRDYHQFCNQVAGRYLHHGPATEEDLASGKNIEDYLQTLSEYKTYFGEPPVHLWPKGVIITRRHILRQLTLLIPE